MPGLLGVFFNGEAENVQSWKVTGFKSWLWRVEWPLAVKKVVSDVDGKVPWGPASGMEAGRALSRFRHAEGLDQVPGERTE